jgi:hypothetical protein
MSEVSVLEKPSIFGIPTRIWRDTETGPFKTNKAGLNRENRDE